MAAVLDYFFLTQPIEQLLLCREMEMIEDQVRVHLVKLGFHLPHASSGRSNDNEVFVTDADQLAHDLLWICDVLQRFATENQIISPILEWQACRVSHSSSVP